MLALDPMLEGGLLWTPLLIVLLKVVVVFVIGLVATMLMVWFERKVIAGMQNRIGPNKAGPFGLLQTLADGIKLFFKEDLIPRRSDRFVFALAPFWRWFQRSSRFPLFPLAEIFGMATMASSRGLALKHGCNSLTRTSACCSPSQFLQSRCMESCWPAGRVVRSIRCWGRYVPRLRW